VPAVDPEPAELPAIAERLAALAAERAGRGVIPGDAAARRATRLRDHLDGHVLPRARSLDAPLLVLLIGPTGAGKSSLVNALAGRRVSPSGVLRPTTRELIALVHPDDRAALLAEGAPLPALAGDRLRVVEDAAAPRGIALVDAPDVDSVEHANRELTDRLAEAADLGVFVTTATRYADRVPWEVLVRARDRGLPLVVVVNRMPEDAADRVDVLDDVDRLLGAFGVDARGLDSTDGTDAVGILAVREGAVNAADDALAAEAVGPLRARIDALGRDRDARRALAARALAGSLAGLGPLLEEIADDAEHEAIDADALRRVATDAWGSELRTLGEDLGRGTFLRAEALRHWQAFVGADEVTRLFSTGIGKVRGTISALIRGTPKAPVAEVREEAVTDIVAIARRHASLAARRVAAAWADTPATRDAVAADPGLWGPSRGFDAELTTRLEAWVEGIGEDVRTTGGPKRTFARGASVGVNVAGIGVMLATFAHTGGLTGVEVGVAAGTAVLNQRLLEALFGEAAMVEMVGRARQRLAHALGASWDEERERYLRLVPPGDELRDLAGRLRDGAREVRSLRPAVPLDAEAIAVAPDEAPEAAPASSGWGIDR
jgi:energy-coupling factor transporter ATP-binding protein EcfA2